MPDNVEQSEFSRRLQAAMAKSKAPPGTPPSGPPAEAAGGTDEFNQRLTSALQPASGGSPGEAADEPVEDAVPVGTGDYIVRSGDCTSSIALDKGHYPETLWNDPGNSDLKAARVNMNVLLPGDRMYIPEKRRRDEAIAAEQRHRFRRRGVPEQLQIGFEDENGEPYSSEAYTIEIDGVVREGFADGSGFIREPIPPGAEQATVFFVEREETYEFKLGGLEPVNTVIGLQKRLKNLGFLSGRVSGDYDDATTAAVRAFQQHYELSSTNGRVDEETRSRLLAIHRS